MNRMLKIAASLLASLSCVSLGAQAFEETLQEVQPNCKLRPNKTILLYPEGQKVDKGIVENGVAITQGPLVDNNWHRGDEFMRGQGNRGKIGDEARIDLYFPKKPNGQMIVVCPGGGYFYASTFNEGTYVADWLLPQGITVCVVKYRMPYGRWQAPLHDVQNAFRYCRAHAAEWKVSKIGVMGFSAGGHLAASASTLWVDEITRPDFSVLVYPVISMDWSLTHKGTRQNLIGTDDKWNNKDMKVAEYEARQAQFASLIERYTLQNQVTDRTPETYMVACADDKTVPVMNSILYYEKLVEHKVPAELHIFPTGGHGWGFNKEKYIGEGKDGFKYARPEFEETLSRWLAERR